MLIKWVHKNNGTIEPFDARKVKRSLLATLRHAGTPDALAAADRFSHEAIERLEGRGRKRITSDDIRQAVLHVLREDKQTKAVEQYELTSLHMLTTGLHAVIKRSGRTETFHPYKLFKSIKRAFADAGEEGGPVAEKLTHEIGQRLREAYGREAIPVAAIRQLTAQVLKDRRFAKAERMYVMHKYL